MKDLNTMKKLHLAIFTVACLLAGAPGWAADAPPAPAKSGCDSCQKDSKAQHEAWMLKKFDANGDGKLDDAEKATMKAAKEARHAEFLKKYDKNSDGKLDDTERAAAKADCPK